MIVIPPYLMRDTLHGTPKRLGTFETGPVDFSRVMTAAATAGAQVLRYILSKLPWVLEHAITTRPNDRSSLDPYWDSVQAAACMGQLNTLECLLFQVEALRTLEPGTWDNIIMDDRMRRTVEVTMANRQPRAISILHTFITKHSLVLTLPNHYGTRGLCKKEEWTVQVLELAGASGCVDTVRSTRRFVVNFARQSSIVVKKASYRNHSDLIRRLCHKKIWSISDDGLYDVLYWGVRGRPFKAIELLLDLDAVDRGANALELAVDRNYANVVKLLLPRLRSVY
jgi:hypothetical protein